MTPVQHTQQPNILILVMDATRAKHLSCYGYERQTTPNIDKIAAKGVVYEQCITAGTWTLASMASMFTGLHVSQHGTTFQHQYLEPEFNTLTQVLSSQGYQTALFSGMIWVSETYGFHRGFDKVNNYGDGVSRMDLWIKKVPKLDKVVRNVKMRFLGASRGMRTYDMARDIRRWFKKERQSDRPFFALAHFGDPHWPLVYHPQHSWVSDKRKAPRVFAPDGHKFVAGQLELDADARQMMVDYYDGEISFLDGYIGRLLDELEADGHLENTLIVIVSDHGEHLTDHGLMGHGMSMYESLLHVPLILYHPKHFAGGQRVSQMVQTTDLFPTVLEMLGLDRKSVPNHLLGRPLQPDLVQANPRPFAVTEYLAPNLRRFKRVCPGFDTTPFDRKLRALRRSDGKKLIWASNGKHELYDLTRDPDELDNLASKNPALLQEMLSQLENGLDGVDPAQFEETKPKTRQAVAPVGGNRPNIIVLIMDAARAGHLSCYGYERKTSPNVDRLAAQGVLYEQCISPSSWTLESMSSLFTGLYPSQHGTNFQHQYLEPQFTTLAETLRGQGYQTAMFATVEWISDIFGTTRGFDTVTNYVQGIRAMRRFFKKTTKLEKLLRLGRWYLYSGKRGKMTYEALRDLRRWFKRDYQSDRPFFAVAHLADPHWPWFHHDQFTYANGAGAKQPRIVTPDAHKFIAGELDVSAAEQAQMVDYYDGEIRFLDHYLGQTLDWLRDNGHLDNTLVVVTADHGEELTEHGLIGHGWSVYDWELHVPFILYHPEYFSGGQRVSEPVQTVDLFPTVLELLGLERGAVSNHLLGHSLQPERVRAESRPFTVSERLAPSLRRFTRMLPHFDVTPLDRQLRALRLRDPQYKLIWGSDGRHELYDLAQDPGEMENLAEREPERLQTLLDQMQSWLDDLDAASFEQMEPEMEEVVVQRLQDLGYL